MSIDIFKPEIWSARLLRHLDRTLVYGQPSVCNRDWEGEINEAGDTVHINKVGDPTIQDYVPGVDLDDPERPDGDTLTLTVDQFKAFNVAIDDIDAYQVNVALLDSFAERAGVALKKVVDAFIAGKMVAGVDADNIVGTTGSPVSVLADGSGDFTPYDLIVEFGRLLADQDAPEGSNWVAINPSLEAEFRKDPNFIVADQGRGAEGVVHTGEIGDCAGFSILRTTGVPQTATVDRILAGAGNYATTFAGQITKIEAYRIQNQFGDGIKGLDVYGAKVLEPQTLALANVGGGTGS